MDLQALVPYTCWHLCRILLHSEISMAFTMPDNALLAGIHATGNALHGQKQSPVHAKPHHARARCRRERVSTGPMQSHVTCARGNPNDEFVY